MEKYFKGRQWKNNVFRNRNARTLGLKPKDYENPHKTNKFIGKILSEFDLIFIAEYLDESLIVMRRKLCWEISDILYLSLNVKTYSVKELSVNNKQTYNGKESSVNNKLTNKVREWSHIDTYLHNIFTKRLKKEISAYGNDFQKELQFYNNQTNRLKIFCSKIVNVVQTNTEEARKLLESNDHIMIPKSLWGNEYKVDYIWCLMSQINLMVLKNIIRVKEYPELCDQLTRGCKNLDLNEFEKPLNKSQVKMSPTHCSKSLTPETSSYQVPKGVLLDSTIYR